MSTKRQPYSENIIAVLGKLFLGSKIKRQLRQAKRELQEDPELLATIDSLNINLEEFERRMNSICDRYPDSAMCKGKSYIK